MVVVAVTFRTVLADEPGPTLKELIQRASDGPELNAVHWHKTYHSAPQEGNNARFLVISLFGKKLTEVVRYTVTEDGVPHLRGVSGDQSRDYRVQQLSPDAQKMLRTLLETLPESKAEPPIERTIHVSFQASDKWRTETYDASALPEQFAEVMKILGIQPETKDRLKQQSP